jgi:hypothetical protein
VNAPRIRANFVHADGTPIPATIRTYDQTGALISETRTDRPEPDELPDPAVVAFLNELGWAMRDRTREAAEQLERLTDEMGLYDTDQEAK